MPISGQGAFHIERDRGQRTFWLRANRSAPTDRQTALIRAVLAKRVGQLVRAQPGARDEPTESVDRLTFSTCDDMSAAITTGVALRQFANIPRIAVSRNTPTVGGRDVPRVERLQGRGARSGRAVKPHEALARTRELPIKPASDWVMRMPSV